MEMFNPTYKLTIVLVLIVSLASNMFVFAQSAPLLADYSDDFNLIAESNQAAVTENSYYEALPYDEPPALRLIHADIGLDYMYEEDKRCTKSETDHTEYHIAMGEVCQHDYHSCDAYHDYRVLLEEFVGYIKVKKKTRSEHGGEGQIELDSAPLAITENSASEWNPPILESSENLEQKSIIVNYPSFGVCILETEELEYPAPDSNQTKK